MHYIISTTVLEFLFYNNVTDQMKKDCQLQSAINQMTHRGRVSKIDFS